MAHQLRLDGLGDASMCARKLEPAERVDSDVTASLEEDAVNGIPAFLVERHAEIIAANPSGSLRAKAYPRSGEISQWATRNSSSRGLSRYCSRAQ